MVLSLQRFLRPTLLRPSTKLGVQQFTTHTNLRSWYQPSRGLSQPSVVLPSMMVWNNNHQKRFQATTPSKTNQVEVNPTIAKDDAHPDSIFFDLKVFLEEESFLTLINLYKDTRVIKFDEQRKKWYVKRSDIGKSFIYKLRKSMRAKNFRLGRFPLEEKNSSALMLAAERLGCGLEKDLIIVQKDLGSFFLIYPKDEEKITSLINEKLTGAMEKIDSPGKLMQKYHIGSNARAYRIFDVWSLAKFQKLLKEVSPKTELKMCKESKKSLDDRYLERKTHQKPIPAVASLLHPGTKLQPYQNEGVRFLQDNGGKGILSFKPGLGKILTTLAYVAAQGSRTVVVCPKDAKLKWSKDANDFLSAYFSEKVIVMDSVTEVTLRKLKKARLVVLNYELLQKRLPSILAAGFDCLVLDESHFLKNPEAARTKLILKVKDKFQKRILLSSTFLKKNVSELLTQLEIVGIENDLSYMSAWEVESFLYEHGVYLRKTIPDNEVAQLRVNPNLSVGRKVLNACQWVLNNIVSKDVWKIIIFTERKSSADALFSGFDSKGSLLSLLHHHEYSPDERQLILHQFEIDDSKNILVTSELPFQIGVNMQHANVIPLNSLSAFLTDIQQAEGKVRRPNNEKHDYQIWMVCIDALDV